MANPVVFSNIPGKFTQNLSPPSQGSAFADGVRMGSVQASIYNNGYQGVLTTPYVCNYLSFGSFNPANPDADPMTALANAGPGYVPITGTKVTINGQQCYALKAPRTINAYFSVAGPTIAIFAQIWGFDTWGNAMCERIDFTIGGSSPQYQQGKKAFAYVYAIYLSAATSGNGGPIIFTGGSRFGMPYLFQDIGSVVPYLRGVIGANTAVTTDTSINFTSGAKAVVPVNVVPGLTASAQTLTSQDPRGWVDVFQGAGASAAGTLVVHQAVMGAGNYDSANLDASGFPSQSLISLYGLPQFNAPLI